MKKLLALALAPAALWAAGCGDSCTNKPAEARVTGAATCDVAASQPVTISVTPACASCADDAPKCDISYVAADQQFLDVQVRECDSNKGCSSASCSFGAVSCSFTPPAASGSITVTYRTGGSTGTLTVNLGAGSGTTCTI